MPASGMAMKSKFEDAAGNRRTVKGDGINHVWVADKPSADDLVSSFPALKGRTVQVKNPPKAKAPAPRPEGAGDASARGKALRARRAIPRKPPSGTGTSGRKKGSANKAMLPDLGGEHQSPHHGNGRHGHGQCVEWQNSQASLPQLCGPAWPLPASSVAHIARIAVQAW